MKKLRFLLMSFVMVFAVISCDKNDELLDTAEYDSLLKSATVDDGVLLKDFKVGNAETECAQVSCDGEFSFKIEAYNDDGLAEGEHVAEGGNTITISNSGEKVFDWESEWPICAVIVKGGPEAVVYYMDGATEGSGFIAPMNPKNGKAYGVSHVTFCYSMQVIAIKVFYNGWTAKAYSAGDNYPFNLNSWCDLLGTNAYPGVTEIELKDEGSSTTVGTAHVENNIVTVELNTGYVLDRAHLYVGTEAALVGDGTTCPAYRESPWISSTSGIFDLN